MDERRRHFVALAASVLLGIYYGVGSAAATAAWLVGRGLAEDAAPAPNAFEAMVFGLLTAAVAYFMAAAAALLAFIMILIQPAGWRGWILGAAVFISAVALIDLMRSAYHGLAVADVALFAVVAALLITIWRLTREAHAPTTP